MLLRSFASRLSAEPYQCQALSSKKLEVHYSTRIIPRKLNKKISWYVLLGLQKRPHVGIGTSGTDTVLKRKSCACHSIQASLLIYIFIGQSKVPLLCEFPAFPDHTPRRGLTEYVTKKLSRISAGSEIGRARLGRVGT